MNALTDGAVGHGEDDEFAADPAALATRLCFQAISPVRY